MWIQGLFNGLNNAIKQRINYADGYFFDGEVRL